MIGSYYKESFVKEDGGIEEDLVDCAWEESELSLCDLLISDCRSTGSASLNVFDNRNIEGGRS